uniref:(northern house mosquito) hypothetical protein n=1 Tax=Culex pipiens TaxID=7175 RepID=A0A8D8HC97_CULPI
MAASFRVLVSVAPIDMPRKVKIFAFVEMNPLFGFGKSCSVNAGYDDAPVECCLQYNAPILMVSLMPPPNYRSQVSETLQNISNVRNVGHHKAPDVVVEVQFQPRSR